MSHKAGRIKDAEFDKEGQAMNILRKRDFVLPLVPCEFLQIKDIFEKHSQEKEGIVALKTSESILIHTYAVSPNGLTERFQMNIGHGSFEFIKLNIHDNFMEAVKETITEKNRIYTYVGPQGIGKSYTVMWTVLKLRTEKNKYRVIYVNNPDAWKSDPRQYIINEMIWAFMEEDEGDLKEFARPPSKKKNKCCLEAWYNFLRDSDDDEKNFGKFLICAKHYCEKKGLKFLAFLDQENAVGSWRENSGYKYPFRFYLDMEGVDKLFSLSSATNDIESVRHGARKDFTDQSYFARSPSDFAFPIENIRGLVERKLKIFMKKDKKAKGLDSDIDKLANQINTATRGNPLETNLLISHLMNFSELSFSNRIKSYLFDKRLLQLRTAHDTFRKPMANEFFHNYFKAMSFIDTGIKLPLDCYPYCDRRLYYLENGELKSIFPLAKAVPIVYLENDFLHTVVSGAYEILSGAGRGIMLESYIIILMQKLINDGGTLKLRYKDNVTQESTTKLFEIAEIEKFVDAAEEIPTKTTLYIPFSPNYPDVDCLIYEPEDKVLYAIQITISQGSHFSSYLGWEKTGAKKWLDIFVGAKWRYIWLIDEEQKITTQDYWVSIFDDLPHQNDGYFSYFLKDGGFRKAMQEVELRKKVVKSNNSGKKSRRKTG